MNDSLKFLSVMPKHSSPLQAWPAKRMIELYEANREYRTRLELKLVIMLLHNAARRGYVGIMMPVCWTMSATTLDALADHGYLVYPRHRERRDDCDTQQVCVRVPIDPGFDLDLFRVTSEDLLFCENTAFIVTDEEKEIKE